MADILLEITAQRRRSFAGGSRNPPTSSRTGLLDAGSHPLLAALRAPERSIVAEVKLGSPRLGDLRREIDAESQAHLYAEAGASALSVVVEPDYFFGSYEILERCRAASGLPTLAKDFIVDARQLDAAAASGASAILLIAALFDATDLRAWARAARERGLAPLIETHSTADLRALRGDAWELVGVNNRDLRTFEVDLGRSRRLLPHLPEGCVSVAESGLSRPRQVERLAAAGFDAFLIGEALLTAADPAAQLRRFRGANVEAAG